MTFLWIFLAVIYILGLFWIAIWGDKEQPRIKKLTRSPIIYSFSLAIYCTAWTFYGTVGEAARSGWNYLPIFLGPILLYLFAFPFLKKLTLVSHKQNITSIADFISSRYGKRPLTAPLVILIALLAIIPYISLQLKAIGSNFTLFVNQGDTSSNIIVLVATILVGVFAILFGTRKVEVTDYRSGMMLAIASESLFKLLAILIVGFLAIITLTSQHQELSFERIDFSVWNISNLFSFSFIMQTLMAAAAVICLPRQFHVTVVDHQDEKQLKTARWVFPLYLLTFALIIPPIAIAGQSLFGNAVNADTYVIQFALNSNNILLEILIFLGGISATTAMIIIATFALSIMISNDVILPLLIARASSHQQALPLYRKKILMIRRLVITGVLVLSYLYYQEMANNEPLAGTGLIAFSLVLQLIPAVVGGLYWKRGHVTGVYSGLILGFLCWLLWMFIPLTNNVSWAIKETGSRTDIIIYGAFISLVANVFGYILGSLLGNERLIDRIQATAFVNPNAELENRFFKPKSKAVNSDLCVLLETFLGGNRLKQVLAEFEKDQTQTLEPNATPNRLFIDYCERILGGVLGGSSARTIINSLLVDKQINIEEMVTYLDETTQAIQFNQNLLFISMDNLDQGISVVDKELQLVAWNKTYTELYPYPKGMLKVGLKVEELIKFNALRGECGVGDVASLVNKRLEHLRKGTTHRFLRRRSNGRVIEMVGNPLPNGGFVTSFTDVTEHIESQQALQEANIDLEKRVVARTQEVQSINRELHQEIERRATAEKELMKAKAEAEKANIDKTEFLALASHDILQPLNAARLYLGALHSAPLNDDTKSTLDKLTASVQSTETLISTLLEIARLDQGAVKPRLKDCSLDELLTPVINEFSIIAHEKGLTIRTRMQNSYVHTDPVYLRRIVQNFVSNAVKYTKTGKVLIACRKRKDHIIIQVWDTGIGIPKIEQEKVFEDFYRWKNTEEAGLGLGLGLVKRMQKALSLTMRLNSVPNKGSCFSITVPLAKQRLVPAIETDIPSSEEKTHSHSCTVWCIDDDKNNVDAMQTLMNQWHCHVQCFSNTASCLNTQGPPHLLLVDYQLGENKNGLDLIKDLREKYQITIPAVLLTAVQDEELIQLCKQLDIIYMQKPAKPARLRALIRSVE
ncbi:PAS domain-containing hybrid sensor histidine kinase/response regulator [Marinomonas algicola]|uniref:hybrid sensor histidine kinase/response regulator n=1 Tax=Marinomonas algicola TaxID=2773454 RepID=UPI00174AF2D8|nr:PAS domain-containing hybrid sensor histidine kinase/response regulator [Marinomonas algicola]